MHPAQLHQPPSHTTQHKHKTGAFNAAGAALIDSLWELQQLVASAALGLFGEYEDLVARDGASKVLPADGTIHPLTAQVLSYIKVCVLCYQ